MIFIISWFSCSTSLKQHHEEVLTGVQKWAIPFQLSTKGRRYNVKPGHAAAATFCSNTSVELTQSYEASNKISIIAVLHQVRPLKNAFNANTVSAEFL